MARKPKETAKPAAAVVFPAPPPVVSAPDPALFVWKGVEYNLRDFVEFRYWFDHDKNEAHAKFLRANGSSVVVPVEDGDGRKIEGIVNPFWGRR